MSRHAHRLCLAIACAVALLPACRAGAARPALASPTASAAAEAAPPRLLAGAGAVAFHPSRPLLAWSDGKRWHVLDLHTGRVADFAGDSEIADLAYAPDGDLWLVGDHAERWRDGRLGCRSEAADLSRALGTAGDGLAAAGYGHSDGVGPLRHPVWIDLHCGLTRYPAEPLPAGVADASADHGGIAGKNTRPPRALPRGFVAPAGTSAQPIAASHDGRWWVGEDAGRLHLYRTASDD
ncbi:hypothetical protein [Lysobacter sp. ESA13C]|uniref:hypothetical protein n=1 Tax=Lysobacter sp. ESA13C TaxID=2862676 RepID=UPI001CC0BC9B|nr:hypothetical protein [Lysobacter sp. ESA13C]